MFPLYRGKITIFIQPRNAHGYLFQFNIIKATGELTAPVSFYMIPSPPIDFVGTYKSISFEQAKKVENFGLKVSSNGLPS